ncbi:MAG: serine/threonine-protein kinase [Nitriliruptorales bacterium]|nr:serine/threonine-protein kinase [Nitriliruptorales bacterium]
MTSTHNGRWSVGAGDVINGRWRLERQVAEGTSVETWEGRDLELQRRVALQIMREADLDDDDAHKAFRRRISLLARVTHTNVVHIYDVVEHDNSLASVWEWIDGIVLEDALRAHLEGWTAAACVGAQLAAGLSALHTNGLTHRNVSPTNVMITAKGIVKVTGGGRIRHLFSDSTLTDRNLLVMETAYLAPERLDDATRDPRIDIYAAGVVLWELATGRRAIELVRDGQQGHPDIPRVSEDLPDVPTALDDAVYAATRSDPGERPADGTALYEALLPALPDRPAAVLAELLEDLELD